MTNDKAEVNMANEQTCGALVRLYLTRQEFPTRASRDAQERCLRRPLDTFGNRRPADISPDNVLAYVDGRRAAGVKDGTIKRELGAFETALRFAARMRRISDTEIPVMPRLKDRAVRLVYMNREERRVFEDRLAGAPLTIRGFGMIGLVFGARAEAIEDLTADRVGDAIDFNVPDRGETRKRRSLNRVPAQIKPLLAELRLAAGGRDARLLPRGTGQAFARWCTAQAWPDGFPRVTPHVLRHTCATLMLEKGATIWEVSRWLNESVATIEKHYGHVTPALQERMAALAAE
jgi:integrase